MMTDTRTLFDRIADRYGGFHRWLVGRCTNDSGKWCVNKQGYAAGGRGRKNATRPEKE